MHAPLASSRAVVLFLLALAHPCFSTPAASTDAAPVHVVFFANGRSEPASDHPPIVTTTTPVVLTADILAQTRADAQGRALVRVDADGKVRDVAFTGDTKAGALAGPIRQALKQWIFAPVRCRGIARAVRIPLGYRLAAPLASVEGAEQGLTAPRMLYTVEPMPPFPFFRDVSETVGTRPVVVEPAREYTVTHLVQTGTTAMGQPVYSTVVMRAATPQREISIPYMVRFPRSWLPAEVSASFEIDAAGVPRNIHVVASTCATLEPEAVAAIRSGEVSGTP